MEEHITTFNTLSGSTNSEYQKNFNAFMQQIKHSDIDINKFLETLQPHHPQQEVFYARLLIEFEHREKILAALQSGNKLIIKTVLRKTDLKTLFHGVTGKQFVEEVCSKLSPSTRVKLMNRLGKSVDCDDYFQHALAAYGIADCKALLVYCKGGVLREHILHSNFRFTDRELIGIFREHGVEFLEMYFVNRRDVNFSKCKRLCDYLLSQDVDSYVKLLKNGCPKLGRRCLKKLLTKNLVDVKDLILKFEEAKLECKKLNRYPNLTHLNLKFKTLYYSLPLQEFQDAYRNSLPEDVGRFLDFTCTTLDFLAKIRKAERGRILFEIFKTKYGFDLHPSLDYINAQILELLALEDRLKFNLENRYEQMLSVDKSIPLLKGKIDVTNDSNCRGPFLNALADTCKVNDDLTALKELLQYFNKRHRNEERYVRDSFLSEILNGFKHERFDEETWKLISDAVDVFTVNKEFFDGIFSFLETEILNRYNKGEDFSKELKRFIKDTGIYVNWNLLSKHPEVERACILKGHEFIEELFENDDQFYAYVSFWETVGDWNKRHRKEKISFLQFPNVLKYMLKFMGQRWGYHATILQRSLRFVPRDDAETEIHQEILKHVFVRDCKYVTDDFSLWLLNTRPDQMLGKAKTFLHKDVCKPNFLRRVARQYFLKIHGEFVATALEIVANPTANEHELDGAFMFLSFIPKHFTLLENCLLTTENSLRMKTLLSYLKFNDVPVKNLKVISYFIKSKYSGLITGCLYNTLHHLREETLLEFVNTCENNQILALATILVNSENSLQIITRGENRLKCLYRLSSRNEKAWELFLKQLRTLKTPPFIPKLAQIPKTRVASLLSEILKFELDTETKYALLKQLEPQQIDSNLLDTILKVYAKSEEDGELKDFIYKVFLHHPKLLHRLAAFEDLIPAVAKLLCVKSLEESELKTLAVTMVKLLSDEISCNFTTSLFTDLTAHYLQNGFENLEHLLIARLRNSVELHGNGIKFIFRNTVKSFLESSPKNTEGELWNLAEKLVRAARDESVLCLAVEILPQTLPKNEIMLRKCCSVVELMESSNVPVVAVFLNRYLRGLD